METTVLVFSGVVLSLVVNSLKSYFNAGKTGSMLITVVLAFVGGVIYLLLTHYGLWEAFWKLLSIATVFYAFILKSVQE